MGSKKPAFKMPGKCPRKLKGIPVKPCPQAISRLENRCGCEWFINDPDSKYCFWYYIHKHPQEQHSVTTISKLWNTSVNNVSIAERSAHVKIIKKITKP